LKGKRENQVFLDHNRISLGL
jgi:hypothetical protein